MNNIKKIILVIGILLVIIIMTIVIMLNKITKQNSNIEKNPTIDSVTDVTWKEVNDYETYYILKNILNKYIVYIQELNGDQFIDNSKLSMAENEIKETLQKEALLGIKGCLDKQYINDGTLDDKKIVLKYETYKQNGTYKESVDYNLDIENIMKADIENNITIAVVKAKMLNKEFNIIIKLDKINSTYSLFLDDYIEKYNYDEDMNKKDININADRIEENGYNKYINVDVTESYIVSQYFSEYRRKMLNNTQEAYLLLEPEYAKSKYGTFQNFKNYVTKNIERIKYSSISKYQVIRHDGNNEYVCIDDNGKYYIFIEESVEKYKVVLDTYTTNLPDFIEKYDQGNEQVKVGMNIEKVIDAINEKDYEYVYSKLDETFKNSNFGNLTTFSGFIENNFFDNNKADYKEFEDVNGVYKYTLEINDENNSENIKSLTIIMKLLEDRDFVMSFSFQ